MYRPLHKFLTIRQSKIEGLGLFATNFIPEGTDLGITHVFNDKFEDNYIRTPLGGFFNHSTSPNCKIVDSKKYLSLKTIKDIFEGDELTAFYTLYSPDM